jgi:hypothetical protein
MSLTFNSQYYKKYCYPPGTLFPLIASTILDLLQSFHDLLVLNEPSIRKLVNYKTPTCEDEIDEGYKSIQQL